MSASKNTRTRLIGAVVAAASIAAFAQPAVAAEARAENVPSSYPALQQMKPIDVMHMMDTEKKGYVTREEFLKFQESLFDRIDRNRDRRLNEVEFTDRG